jgi:hypothetical protein
MVAALAAALWSARPNLTVDQLTTLLCQSARDLPPAGWDRRTGCGSPDYAAALRLPAPRADPAEPNDDVVWVDGIGLGRPASVLPPDVHHASLTAHDDPADLYRVRLPGRSRTTITLRPALGGADLLALEERAQDLHDASALLGRSRLPGRRADALELTNPKGSARIAYVAVTHDARAGVRRVAYALHLSRRSNSAR